MKAILVLLGLATTLVMGQTSIGGQGRETPDNPPAPTPAPCCPPGLTCNDCEPTTQPTRPPLIDGRPQARPTQDAAKAALEEKKKLCNDDCQKLEGTNKKQCVDRYRVCVADAQNDAKAKLDTARANGELLHPEKGTLMPDPPAAGERFNMDDFEGIGSFNDNRAFDGVGDAVRAPPRSDAIKLIFTKLDCDAEVSDCTRKCSQRLDVSGVDGPLSDVKEGDTIRVVPASFQECKCGEGTGTYVGAGRAFEVVFQEGFGDRTTEMVYDAEAKVVTVNFLSLFWSTGIDCTATYGVADPLNPTMTTKAYPGRGAPVQIDYAKLLEADELGKKAGGKLPDKSTTEAAEAADSMYSTSFQTIKSLSTTNGRRSRRGGRNSCGATCQEQLALLAAGEEVETTEAAASATTAAPLPTDFHSHEAYPECEPPVHDQGSCGSCWAFSTTGVLAQRMCIASDGATADLVLSPQALLTCADQCENEGTAAEYCNGGCDGGYSSLAFKFMMDGGSTPENCVAYESAAGSDPLECSAVTQKVTACDLGADSDTLFKASATYAIGSEEDIMEDVYNNGPVQATFLLESELYGYSSGVYECDTDGGDLGGHATILVGWGVEDEVPYWWIQNSWGPTWGDKGYFKIRRGENSCLIETYIDTALPVASSVKFNADEVTISTAKATHPTPMHLSFVAFVLMGAAVW